MNELNTEQSDENKGVIRTKSSLKFQNHIYI